MNGHEDHHHHHNQEKGPNHEGEERENAFDFLGFLLGNHLHSYHSESIPVRQTAKQQLLCKYIAPNTFSDHQLLTRRNCSKAQFESGHAPPDIFYSIYLTTSFLRGPPNLG